MQRDMTATITAIASLVLVAGPGAWAAEQTATWTETGFGGESGNWSDASKWSTTDYPDNGNGGVATYDASIVDGFGSVVVTLDVDVTIEGFNFDGVASSGALNRSANLTVNDTFSWDRGSMTGSGTLTLAAGSTSNITASRNRNIRDGDIVNHGTFNKASGGRLLFRNADFINHGTADAQGDGTFIERNSFSNAANVLVNNQGVFLKSAGTGDTIFNAVKVDNAGTIEVQTGRLGFARGFAGASPGYTQTAGTLRLNGGDVFADSVAMDIQGGSVQGDGIISGDIIMAGTITPGSSIGTLTIDDNANSANGDLAFASGGEYVAELGTPGLADLLDITGTLDLSTAGDTLTLSGGVLGETYTIANFNQVLGSFDNVTAGYLPTYNTDSLQVTVVPEPGSISLLALSGMLLLRRRVAGAEAWRCPG